MYLCICTLIQEAERLRVLLKDFDESKETRKIRKLR